MWIVDFLSEANRASGRRLQAASEVREAILPETTKKILTYVQDFGEGGRRPKAGQQARREQYKIFGEGGFPGPCPS